MKQTIEITPNVVIDTPISYKEVFITWLPNDSKRVIIDKAKELYEAGYMPVPHISTKKIKDYNEAKLIATELKEFTNKILIIGGSGKKEGIFGTVSELVATGAFDYFKIGVGGFPEGNGDISFEEGIEILKEKSKYASFVVTQWSLDKKSIKRFLDESPLPVYVGVPNKCNIKNLINYAYRCGLENSVTAFINNPRNIFKFMMGFNPNYIVKSVNGHENLEAIHVYSFGNLKPL